MKLTPLLAALGLAISTASLAAQVGTGPAAARADPTERRVCRSYQRTGSNIRVRRVCLTESQWAQRDRLDRERVEDVGNRPNMACSYGGTASCQ